MKNGFERPSFTFHFEMFIAKEEHFMMKTN